MPKSTREDDMRSSVVGAQRVRVWAFAAIAIGIALRLIAFVYSSNNGGDSFARIAVTADWLHHPSLRLDLTTPDWPPIHFWLAAATSALVGDAALGSRLLSLIAGCASVWLVWRLALELYDEVSAIYSTIIFSLYSLAIGYSATASSEAIYISLLLAGFFSFFHYRKSGRVKFLALAGIALTIDAGIRYESWVFIVLLTLLLIFAPAAGDQSWRAKWPMLLVFAATAGAWPIFWLMHEWHVWGNPIYFLSFNHDAVPQQLALAPSHSSLLYQVALIPLAILLTLTPVVVVAALYSAVIAFRRRQGVELVILTLAFAAIELHTIATHGSLALARYSITLGTMVTLLAGFGLKSVVQEHLRWPVGATVGGVGCLLVANLVAITGLSMSHFQLADRFRAVSPLLQFPQHIEEVQAFLRRRLTPSDYLIIDDYNSEPNLVSAALGLSVSDISRTYLIGLEPASNVTDYVARSAPRYVVTSGSAELKRYIPFPSTCSGNVVSVANEEFRCVFQGRIYRIYQMAPSDTQVGLTADGTRPETSQ